MTKRIHVTVRNYQHATVRNYHTGKINKPTRNGMVEYSINGDSPNAFQPAMIRELHRMFLRGDHYSVTIEHVDEEGYMDVRRIEREIKMGIDHDADIHFTSVRKSSRNHDYRKHV